MIGKGERVVGRDPDVLEAGDWCHAFAPCSMSPGSGDQQTPSIRSLMSKPAIHLMVESKHADASTIQATGAA